MLVYPIPHAVTQARVQLVADQTEKAPSHVIQADVLNVFTAKNEASRQALEDFKSAQAEESRAAEAHVAESHVDVKA
ncbi:hypothetical protein [Bradyrhizobium sp.]|uniref:hypothetical protein n=1 Tax=Bradyrhizobium sp. TaxID=376 RepID=UPI004037E924